MTVEKEVNISADELYKLIKNKLESAGLPENQAIETSKHLVYADLSGIHSHGAVRVEYYAERIAKGGINLNPELSFEKTGASTGIFHGDNAQGQFVSNEALEPIIKMAKESGVAIVGVSRSGHVGTLSYFLNKIADEDLIGISMCQSDPMVVPYGGSEVYYGTNPIAIGVPRTDGEPIVFDMATTVQAWGKILDARSKNMEIPDTWAVDDEGKPTTNPNDVAGLLPISGPKGYGLMMMVDILSGVLLGLPFGKDVSSMYEKLSKGRELGQIYIVIDPSRFRDIEDFKKDVTKMVNDLHEINPANGFKQVYYPGEVSYLSYEKGKNEGTYIPKEIVDYLQSDTVHFNQYDGTGPFAK